MDKLKVIKLVVFILTFLLIFSTLSIIGLFLKKAQKNTTDTPQQISLNQPLGSYVKDMQINDNKVYLLMVGGGEEDRIIIYDHSDNKITTTIKIK